MLTLNKITLILKFINLDILQNDLQTIKHCHNRWK